MYGQKNIKILYLFFIQKHISAVQISHHQVEEGYTKECKSRQAFPYSGIRHIPDYV